MDLNLSSTVVNEAVENERHIPLQQMRSLLLATVKDSSELHTGLEQPNAQTLMESLESHETRQEHVHIAVCIRIIKVELKI